VNFGLPCCSTYFSVCLRACLVQNSETISSTVTQASRHCHANLLHTAFSSYPLRLGFHTAKRYCRRAHYQRWFSFDGTSASAATPWCSLKRPLVPITALFDLKSTRCPFPNRPSLNEGRRPHKKKPVSHNAAVLSTCPRTHCHA
jgi:hypothetical protein